MERWLRVTVFYYCQHVLGVGHFFRTLEICRALAPHRVVLAVGGGLVDAEIPRHVEVVSLPALHMDAEFSGLLTENGADLEKVKEERRQALAAAFAAARPDVLVVELYPFGRKAFGFELDPILSEARASGRVRVVSSLRDILVEKNNQEAYEKRVVDRVNRFFDAVLVHADPALVRLDETFSRVADIRPPVIYTGFVTPAPDAAETDAARKRFCPDPGEALVVASAGGGSVGGPLLSAVLGAFPLVCRERPARLLVLTGPYLPENEAAAVRSQAGEGVTVLSFTRDFVSLLAAANLSVSMAGYNTMMNVLSAGVRGLVLPFDQNREQRLRAERLAAFGSMGVLSGGDLSPHRLSRAMLDALAMPKPQPSRLNLDGAAASARIMEEMAG